MHLIHLAWWRSRRVNLSASVGFSLHHLDGCIGVIDVAFAAMVARWLGVFIVHFGRCLMRLGFRGLFDVVALLTGSTWDWTRQLAVLTAEDSGGRSCCGGSVSAL